MKGGSSISGMNIPARVPTARPRCYSICALSAIDSQSAYLTNFLGLPGITDIEFVYAEGLAISAASKEAAIAQARETIKQLNAKALSPLACESVPQHPYQ